MTRRRSSARSIRFCRTVTCDAWQFEWGTINATAARHRRRSRETFGNIGPTPASIRRCYGSARSARKRPRFAPAWREFRVPIPTVLAIFPPRCGPRAMGSLPSGEGFLKRPMPPALLRRTVRLTRASENPAPRTARGPSACAAARRSPPRRFPPRVRQIARSLNRS